MRCKDQQLGTNFQGSRWICFREICTSCKTGSCEPRRISDPGGFVRSERKSRRACDVEWRKSWSDCAAAVFACAQTAPRKGMCGLHFLPPPLLSHTHTHLLVSQHQLQHTKKNNNKGRKYSKRSALIYCHFSEGDSDSEDFKKIQQQ